MDDASDSAGGGERLDRYLVRLKLAASRRAARALVLSGAVRINGRRAHQSDPIAPGDTVEVDGPPEPPALIANPELELRVLFEDSALLVVAKSALIPCHPLRAGERDTVMNAVVARYPETASVGEKLAEGGLVHRLDNGTSGALIVARTAASFRALSEAVRAGRVARRYEALVAGRLDEPLRIALPIAHHRKNPRKMMAVREPSQAARLGARPALTEVRPLAAAGPFTLVEVAPRTGRRHQIRVHLAAAGLPIAGDLLYGGPALPCLAPGRFCLHLRELRLRSPASGDIVVEAARPADFEAALR